MSVRGSAAAGAQALTQTVSIPVVTGDFVVAFAGLSPQSVYNRISGLNSNNGYNACMLQTITSPGISFAEIAQYSYTENPNSGDGSLQWVIGGIATQTGTVEVTGTMAIDIATTVNPAWTLIAFSVPGATGFDPNPTLGGNNIHYDFNDCNPTDGCQVHYSTTAQNTMVLYLITYEGNPTPTPPPQATMIEYVNVPGWVGSAICYWVLTAPATDTTTGNWTTVVESAAWAAIALDLNGSVTPPSLTPTQITLAVTRVSG